MSNHFIHMNTYIILKLLSDDIVLLAWMNLNGECEDSYNRPQLVWNRGVVVV